MVSLLARAGAAPAAFILLAGALGWAVPAAACSIKTHPRAQAGEQFGGWAIECSRLSLPDRAGDPRRMTRTRCYVGYAEVLQRQGRPAGGENRFRQLELGARSDTWDGPRTLSFFSLGAAPNAVLRIEGRAQPVPLACEVRPAFATCGTMTTCRLAPDQLDGVVEELLRARSAAVVDAPAGESFPIDLSRFREAWTTYLRVRPTREPR